MAGKPITSAPSIEQARRLLAQGLVDAAQDLCDQCLARRPRDLAALQLRSAIAQRKGDFAAAAGALESLIRARPDDPRLHVNLANALFRDGALQRALEACDQALRLAPGLEAAILVKASTRERQGEYEAALADLQPLLEAGGPPEPEVASIAAKVMHGLRRYEEAIALGRRAAESAPDERTRKQVWFQLFKTYDKLSRWSEAMEACAAAHQGEGREFDPAAFVRHVDALIETFSARNLATLPRAGDRSQAPVFVIGMPRSGTTLTEQIIHAHPQGFGAGELTNVANLAAALTAELASIYTWPDCVSDLTQEAADRIAAPYLAHLASVSASKGGPGGAARVVNKALQQYDYVGLIALLWPGARIIHCLRNPLDTCLSCYTRPISSVRLPWVADLAHLGLAYRQHERLMEHWKQTLDLPIFTIQYEALVKEPEPNIRALIEFLGLPWDNRCLHAHEEERAVMTLSYDQVNKPIYDSSIDRWKNYASHLGPLQEALEMHERREGAP